MTHGFKNGRVIAEQGTVERVGVGEFLKFDDGTDNFQTFSSNGSPEGVIAADKGSVSHDISTGSLYTKTTDTVNTGWECLAAAGGVAGSGITFLAGATASSSATIDFTSFIDSTYNLYMFVFQNIKSVNDGVYLRASTSPDGGATYDTTAGDYAYQTDTGFGPSSHIRCTAIGNLGNATNEKADGILYMVDPAATEYTMFFNYFGAFGVAGTLTRYEGAWARESAAAVDAIQFDMDSGNIASGTIKLYGLVTPA